MGGCCPRCKNHMSFEKNAEFKVTVQRRVNELAHLKKTCELLCKRCNVTLSGKDDN